MRVKYHTIGTVLISNRKIVGNGKIGSPSIQLHDPAPLGGWGLAVSAPRGPLVIIKGSDKYTSRKLPFALGPKNALGGPDMTTHFRVHVLHFKHAGIKLVL